MTTPSSPAPDVHEELRRLRRQVETLDRQREALARAREIQSGANRVLERLAYGAPLEEVTHLLVVSVERVSAEMLGSILILDEEGRRLRHGAAPSLPAFYNEAIDGLEIGPAVGSCGTCAYTGERIIVEDVMTHPFWADYRELARRAGLRACWSHPIVSSTGTILGTFAMYYREPRQPHQSDLNLITFAAHVAGIAIERKRTEEALRSSEQRLRALFENAPVCIHEIGLDGRLLSINPAGVVLIGARDPGELIGKRFLECVGQEDRERVAGHLEQARAGTPAEFEFTTYVGGQPRIFASYMAPLRDAAGEVARVMGVAHDVTERIETERRRGLLVQELDHRVKNNLATVLSIAEQTADRAESLGDFDVAFRGRIRSMAVAHEMLAQGNWEGVELHRMLGRIVEPHRRGHAERISLTGPLVTLPATLAPPICMVFHELAVNAAKYGALSGPDGRVAISWTREAGDRGEERLELTWEESEGPPVGQPARRGRGTDLIERMIDYQLRGSAKLRFPATGVRCEISVPLGPAREAPVEDIAT